MKRINPPFSGRSPLKSVTARLLSAVALLLIGPCTYLLSQDEQPASSCWRFWILLNRPFLNKANLTPTRSLKIGKP